MWHEYKPAQPLGLYDGSDIRLLAHETAILLHALRE